MENNRIKFSNSKFYEINRILNKKPWKYIYKELMPKSLYKSIQRKVDFLQQEAVAKSWDRIIEAYFEGETEKIEVFPKKNLAGRKIIWQYWGTGWEYGKLPDIVKLCYKSADKYKGNYEIIRLDNENMKEYIEFPEFVMEKIENGSMGYTHFSDLLRLALLDSYGGVWLDASILMTGSLSEYSASAGIENKGYFMFQRSDSTENKEFWEKLNSDYFSWDKRNKVRVLNSVIFSEKNNKMIHSLLELMLTFWKNESEIPHYFFFQILYNELVGKYMTEEKCEVVDDTLPHILFSRWNERFSEMELSRITEKTNVHKLTQKGISKENCIPDSFYDYFNKKFDV